MCILKFLAHDFSQMDMCHQAKFQSNVSRMVMSWNKMVMQSPKNELRHRKQHSKCTPEVHLRYVGSNYSLHPHSNPCKFGSIVFGRGRGGGGGGGLARYKTQTHINT